MPKASKCRYQGQYFFDQHENATRYLMFWSAFSGRVRRFGPGRPTRCVPNLIAVPSETSSYWCPGYLAATLLMLIMLISGAGTTMAGGFPKMPGEATIILGHYRYIADRFWDSNRDLQQYGFGGEYRSASTKLFVEYGIDGNLTLFGSLPYAVAVFENEFGSATSRTLTDAEAGARYRIRRGPDESYHVSLQATALVPLYKSGLNPVPGYRKTGLDLRIMLAGGFELGSRPAFYSADTGFRVYPGSDILQWVYAISGGFKLAGNWEFLYEFSGMASRSDSDVFTPENILLNTDFNFHKAGAGLFWKPTDTYGIIANVYTDYLGRQSARGRAVNLSLLVFI
jgi:hypothetical protein